MQLCFIRHAEAVPRGEGDINADADRQLTDLGQEQAKKLAAALQRIGLSIDLVLTSPLLRARQTAQGLIDHWNGDKPELRECPELAPGGKIKKLARTLLKFEAKSIALVGHMPDLSGHTGWLIGSKKTQIDFEKAGAALIACKDAPDKGAGELLWLITPEWF